MHKGAKLKFRYDCMTPTVRAWKTTTNLQRWWSIANTNEGTARKKWIAERPIYRRKRQAFPHAKPQWTAAFTQHCKAVRTFKSARQLGSLTQLVPHPPVFH